MVQHVYYDTGSKAWYSMYYDTGSKAWYSMYIMIQGVKHGTACIMVSWNTGIDKSVNSN